MQNIRFCGRELDPTLYWLRHLRTLKTAVIPAQAGIQKICDARNLDPRLRGDDENMSGDDENMSGNDEKKSGDNEKKNGG